MATLKNTTVDTTGAIQLPVGTTAQRPTASAGQMRYNSTFKTVETYDGTRWRYMPDIVRLGLVLNLDAGEPSSYPGSGTTWTDLSGNGNNGTLVNGVGYNSSNGSSLVFDGVNDYVDIPTSSIPSGNEITISVWNYGIENRQSTIIGGTRDISTNPQDFNIHLAWSDGNIYWDIGNPFNRINKVPTSAEFLGWHHWAFTKNANTGIMQIYNDGNLFHSGSGLTSAIPTMQRVRIGTYQSLIYYHLGRIGPMQIYNRALSTAEIQQNFKATRSRYLP